MSNLFFPNNMINTTSEKLRCVYSCHLDMEKLNVYWVLSKVFQITEKINSSLVLTLAHNLD